MSSNTQMIVFGSYAFGAGLTLVVNPIFLVNSLKPITGLLESLTGLVRSSLLLLLPLPLSSTFTSHLTEVNEFQ